jgi:hypothetical protein
MEKNKQKFALWVSPDTMNRVEDIYKKDACRSRSEFIEKAINFYCGFLCAKDYGDYIPEVFITTMQASMDSMENRMANLLFKNAVELSILSHLMAAQTNVDQNTVDNLRQMCIKDVKRTQGTIRLEDAYRFQKPSVK